ncbi:MAG: HAD-IC family P-type ATPase, partial [Candidatus Altiarchaeales archaeon]|nr:HAD-IC family P-type ATPase [Candidatus Altiarchaeales archaeon]
QIIESFIIAIALAVSAVPEGLPAVVTISLALGARELVKKNAIIRKLASAETLGATTVICSDKTGTLTKNEMTIRKLYVGDDVVDVTGEGYSPTGEFLLRGEKIEIRENESLKLLLRIGALCNNASLGKTDGRWTITGDPTEACLIVASEKAGLEQERLEREYPRVGEMPFDSERKMMTTIHEIKEEKLAYVKGAPDMIMEKCDRILDEGRVRAITEEDRDRILKMNENFGREALRILSIAYREIDAQDYTPENTEKNLVFVGLAGMIDPPREDAIGAVEQCRKAGINSVMITGDHKITAIAVAKEVGMYRQGDRALTGIELDDISDEELDGMVEDVSIYARVSPQHKLRIVDALKKRGHVVAMTGDGVNDAPALKRADIGIAMGITGTDVSKEASDMVLVDDNFSSIVSAV